jgi:hypothetical protein
MHLSMYRLRQGSMSVTEFKFEFDEYRAYFPSWTENDRVEFFVEYLRDSIKYKVNPYAPSTLGEAFHLAINFKLEVGNRVEGGLNRFGKRPTGTSSQNQMPKSTKFSQSDRVSKPQEGRKGFRAPRLCQKELGEHHEKKL